LVAKKLLVKSCPTITCTRRILAGIVVAEVRTRAEGKLAGNFHVFLNFALFGSLRKDFPPFAARRMGHPHLWLGSRACFGQLLQSIFAHGVALAAKHRTIPKQILAIVESLIKKVASRLAADAHFDAGAFRQGGGCVEFNHAVANHAVNFRECRLAFVVATDLLWSGRGGCQRRPAALRLCV